MTLLFVIYIVAPIGVYLILSWLTGYKAILGFAIAGAGLAALWLSYLFSVGPLFTGDGRADVFATAAAVLLTGAVGLALVAHLMRGYFGVSQRGTYILLVAALLIITGVPLLFLYGV